MASPFDRMLDDLDAGCPVCDEEPAEAHVRGREIVLVPCGHTIDATAALGMRIPDDVDAPPGDAPDDSE